MYMSNTFQAFRMLTRTRTFYCEISEKALKSPGEIPKTDAGGESLNFGSEFYELMGLILLFLYQPTFRCFLQRLFFNDLSHSSGISSPSVNSLF